MKIFIILTFAFLASLAISVYGKPKKLKNIIKFLFTSTGSYSLKISFALFFLIPNVNAATFNDNKPTIILNGPWRFNTGDNLLWANPNFDDSEWETVDLAAAAGAHDGDVGLTGYVAGWAAKGHLNYSGYAWYRLSIASDRVNGNTLALVGPPAVDDTYQLFVNFL